MSTTQVVATVINPAEVSTKHLLPVGNVVKRVTNSISVEKQSRNSSLSDYLISTVHNVVSEEDELINTLGLLQNTLLKQGHEPSKDIHSSNSFAFYRDVLKAPADVLSILKEGYFPQFIEEPPSFFKVNNKSARDQMDFVRCLFCELSFEEIKLIVNKYRSEISLHI